MSNKMVQLIGVLVLLLGVIQMAGHYPLGPILVLAGLLTYAIAKVVAWLK